MSAPSSPSNEIVPMTNDMIVTSFMATNKTFDRIKETFEMIGVQTQKNTEAVCVMSTKMNQLTDFAHTLSKNMETLSKNMETIASEGDRIAKDVDDIRGELRELKKKGAGTNLLHFTLHYLMRLGMDTRLGYMCAVPVLGRTRQVYVVVSLNLLATTCAKFFKSHREGKTIAKFYEAFESVSVKEQKESLVKEAMKMLAFKEKNYTSSEGSKWVVLRAEVFVKMCKDAVEEGEDEWEGLENVVATKDLPHKERGYTFSKQTNCVTDSKEPKMSWGKKMSTELLGSEHMVAYREIIGDEMNVDPEKPHHFSADRIFPLEEDEEDVPVRRGKNRADWGRGGTKGYAPSIAEELMEDEESEEDSDSESEEEEEEKASPKRKREDDSSDDFEETAEDFQRRYMIKLAECGSDSSELGHMARKRKKN